MLANFTNRIEKLENRNIFGVISMTYYAIYYCYNLCSSRFCKFYQTLRMRQNVSVSTGTRYEPTLQQLGITPQGVKLGMVAIDARVHPVVALAK